MRRRGQRMGKPGQASPVSSGEFARTLVPVVKVRAFFFAQQIHVPPDGGIDVSGGFLNEVVYDSYPQRATLPMVVVMEQTPTDEAQTGTLEIVVYDKSETVVDRVNTDVRLEARHPNAPYGLPAYMPMPVPLSVLVNEPGMYRMVLLVNGKDEADYMFHAKLRS